MVDFESTITIREVYGQNWCIHVLREQFSANGDRGVNKGHFSTVEPLNKGHFGSTGFVLFSEVVLWWEVQANRFFIDLIYLDNMF